MKLCGEFITRIDDVTSFVHEQYSHVCENRLDILQCPVERVYVPKSEELCRYILLDGFDLNAINKQKEVTVPKSVLLDNDLENQGAWAAPTLPTRINNLSLKHPGKTQNIVVILEGAFNPVHTRHVQALRVAVDWLEEHTTFRVVDARLAPASQGYVNSKCRKHRAKCIKENHRLKLCELAYVDESVENPFPKVIRWTQKFNRCNMPNNTRVGIVLGADRAIAMRGDAKWNTKDNRVTICVGRECYTDKVKKSFLLDEDCGCVENKDFFIVDKELDNVSSSAIRRQLLKIDSQKE